MDRRRRVCMTMYEQEGNEHIVYKQSIQMLHRDAIKVQFNQPWNIFKSQIKIANIEKTNKGYRVYIKPRKIIKIRNTNKMAKRTWVYIVQLKPESPQQSQIHPDQASLVFPSPNGVEMLLYHDGSL
jgi:hypothetical protein